MKDEEMADKHAEEYRKTFRYYRVWHGLVVDKSPSTIVEQSFKDGFFAGLKAGRPQWHDLRKDPNDLPKKNGEYFCKVNSHWEKYGVKHFTLQPYGYNRQWEGQGYSVIAWCEIPTFDKE